MNTQQLSVLAISQILDKGLQKSTWGEEYPQALKALEDYRLDMQLDIQRVLDRHAVSTPPSIA